MRHGILLASGVLLVVGLAARWACAPDASGALEGDAPNATRADADAPAGLDAPAGATDRVASAPARADAPAANASEVDERELLARLRAVSAAFLAHDAERLATALESVLGYARLPRRVLALLESRRAAPDTPEGEGAVLAGAFAAALEAKGRSLAHEGRAFRADLLDALARLDPDVGEALAGFTAHLRANGRPAIGVAWLARIERLRRERPDHAASFEPLLAEMAASAAEMGSGAGEASELDAIVRGSSDAPAVQAALAALLATRPEEYLSVAESLYAASERDRELSHAVEIAIARHVPVEDASTSLVRLVRDDPYAAFAELGARPGGSDAAVRRYGELVATDADPRARKLLVSSMSGEGLDALVGIARTDTAPEVRQQALLTAALRPAESTVVVDALRDLHALRGGGGLSTAASLPVAENVLRNGAGGARREAVAFLRQIVADPRESPADRRSAWDRLRAAGDPADLAGLESPP